MQCSYLKYKSLSVGGKCQVLRGKNVIGDLIAFWIHNCLQSQKLMAKKHEFKEDKFNDAPQMSYIYCYLREETKPNNHRIRIQA